MGWGDPAFQSQVRIYGLKITKVITSVITFGLRVVPPKSRLAFLVTPAAISLILARERRGALPETRVREVWEGQEISHHERQYQVWQSAAQWYVQGRRAHRPSEALREEGSPFVLPGSHQPVTAGKCSGGPAGQAQPPRWSQGSSEGVCQWGWGLLGNGDASRGGAPCGIQGGSLLGPAPLEPE